MTTGRFSRAWLRAWFAITILLASAAHAADDWKIDADTFEGMRARSIGPGVMGGRVAAIDGHVGDRIELWVGTAGGGVWVSKDAATTWKPVFDKHTMSIGAVRIVPGDPKTVWVGTGESWVRNSVSVGDGVWKTTDGGDSWKQMGLTKSERIGKIEVDPQHPDTVFVAATGPLWGPGGERGVYRTHDGGTTWERVLFVNDDTGCADIAMDPRSPNVIYAAMWQVRRKAWTFASGGPGSGLYRSTDGGTTWKRLTNGLPSGDLGRIGLAVSPARPGRVFAVVEAKPTAFYRSDDFGESWLALNSANANVTFRPFYFAAVIPDPKNPDRVYKPGLTLSVSDDAGKTFGAGGAFGANYHSDVHALWIHPDDTDFLVQGNDGGVYVSMDRGTTWRAVQNLPIGQFYHVSVDNRTPYRVYGGLQDNGTWSGPSRASGGVPNRAWESLFGGDGFLAFVDPKDDDFAYVEYQGGNLARVRLSTGEVRLVKPLAGSSEPKLRWNWNTPIHVSPTRDGTVYVGSQYLHRSRDRGDTWERLGGDLTTNDPLKQQQDKSGGISVDNSSAENHCTVYTIAESPKEPNTVWVGTDDGNVQITRDGGKTWANVTKQIAGLPPFSWVSHIEASPHDAGTAFATFDRHMENDFAPYVFVTRDYGRTWKALADSGLRGHAHTVKQDLVNPDVLFVGTELGLFVSLDGGAQWAPFKVGMPAVAVRDLVIHPREGDLVIATHGRGIWIVDDLTPLRGLTRAVLAADGAFLPTRPSTLTSPSQGQRFDGDTEYAGETLGEQAVITYYLKKRHMIGDLKVEVFDPSGRKLATIPGSKRRGINRVEWPMRLKGPKVPPAANLVPNQYAFVGPRAEPGRYTAKLTRNKDSYTTEFELVPDPRSTHSAADRAQQGKVVRELYDRILDLTFISESALDLSKQARAHADSLGRDAGAAKLRAFADRMDNWRGTIAAMREGGRLTGEERLRERLVTLYGDVNGYDGRPTQAQIGAKESFSVEVRQATSALDALLAKELPPVNTLLRAKGRRELERTTRTAWDEKLAKE